jgi:hypothetical protein
MNPASGRTSYSSAERPGRPVRCPAVRTRPARSASASATDTVGLDRPEMRASSAREHGPRSRMCPSKRRPFSARMSWGRAADSSPPSGPPTPLANGSWAPAPGAAVPGRTLAGSVLPGTPADVTATPTSATILPHAPRQARLVSIPLRVIVRP